MSNLKIFETLVTNFGRLILICLIIFLWIFALRMLTDHGNCKSAAVLPQCSGMDKGTMESDNEFNHETIANMYDNGKTFGESSFTEYRSENLTRIIKVSINDEKYFYDAEGVMAVVQNMKLTTDINGQCLDFLQFSDLDGNNLSDRLCGRWSQVEIETNPQEEYFMSHISSNTSMLMIFSLFLNGKDVPVLKTFSVQLTNYYVCPGPETLAEEEVLGLKRCRVSDPMSCIRSNMFCDGVLNCADFGEGIGFDEKNCNNSDFPHITQDEKDLDPSGRFNFIFHRKEFNSDKERTSPCLVLMVIILLTFAIALQLTFAIYTVIEKMVKREKPGIQLPSGSRRKLRFMWKINNLEDEPQILLFQALGNGIHRWYGVLCYYTTDKNGQRVVNYTPVRSVPKEMEDFVNNTMRTVNVRYEAARVGDVVV